MSRVGIKPLIIPENVTIEILNNKIKVKGPKGELQMDFDKSKVDVIKENNIIKVLCNNKNEKENVAYWGTVRRLIENMVIGVINGYEKKLIVEGLGYKVSLQGNKLILTLGYSRPVEVEIPKDLNVSVKENIITISGIDKYKVGQFAASLRAKRKPDIYKGKGIRYIDERLKLKVGKTGV